MRFLWWKFAFHFPPKINRQKVKFSPIYPTPISKVDSFEQESPGRQQTYKRASEILVTGKKTSSSLYIWKIQSKIKSEIELNWRNNNFIFFSYPSSSDYQINSISYKCIRYVCGKESKDSYRQNITIEISKQ